MARIKALLVILILKGITTPEIQKVMAYALLVILILKGITTHTL